MTDEELQRLCDEWKSHLKIAWDIKARFVHRHEIDGNFAQTTNRPQMEEAEVKVSFDSEREDDGQTTDTTLVHELLHVRFWSANRRDFSDVEDRVYEAGIEATARALVSLKNREKGKE